MADRSRMRCGAFGLGYLLGELDRVARAALQALLYAPPATEAEVVEGDAGAPQRYAFRIKCWISGADIESGERQIALSLPQATRVMMNLPQRPPGDLQGQETVYFVAGGFETEARALAVGTPITEALRLLGPLLGIGVDVENDEVDRSNRFLVDGRADDRTQPDVRGLLIFPDVPRVIFGGLRVGRPVRRLTPGDVERSIGETYGRPVSPKQSLAARLYNQSHFQSSDAARFLTLISAVEALAEQVAKSPAARALLDRIVETARASEIKPGEKEALCNGLANLKMESVRSACRRLVRRHLGDEAGRQFRRAYGVRSTLLHDGRPSAGTDLPAEIRMLDSLVRQLIVSDIRPGLEAAR